jgi:hypothetical protein
MPAAAVSNPFEQWDDRCPRGDERTDDTLVLGQIHRLGQRRRGRDVQPLSQLRLRSHDSGLHRLGAVRQVGLEHGVKQIHRPLRGVQGEMGSRQHQPFQAPREPDCLARGTQQIDGCSGRPRGHQRLRLGHGAPAAEQIGQRADARGSHAEWPSSRRDRGGAAAGCRELDGGDAEDHPATGIGPAFARRQSPVDLHGGRSS